MSAPTPVAETYIPCVGLAGTIAGLPLAVTTGGFGVKVETDDMTNNQGYGFYEDVPTVKTANFKMTIASKSAGLTGLLSGGIYAVLINCTSMPAITAGVMAAPTPTNANAPAFAGNVRLTLDDAPILDVKTGVKLSFTGMSQAQFAYAI